MDGCLSETTLVELAQGKITLSARDDIDKHIDNCPSCRRLLAEAVRTAHPRLDEPRLVNATDEERPPPSLVLLTRGATFERYVILEPVGIGAMGVVYAAYDSKLDRKVALKLLHRDPEQSPEAHEGDRLVREAQSLARLSHPNVISVYDVGSFCGQAFLAMEFVAGETLTSWLHKERRPLELVLEVFRAAGSGLGAAHRARLIHRDFKPDNVLVGEDGRVRVTDFGLARPVMPAPAASAGATAPLGSSSSSSRMMVGTPAYMSPEQRERGTVDARSDQYSFCTALHEALYGHRPAEQPNSPDDNMGERGEPKASPSHVEAIPSTVARVIWRGLSPDPNQRYPSMEALLSELGTRPRRWKKKLVVATLATIAVIAGVGLERRAMVADRLVCKGAERYLNGMWDPATQQAIQAAFARTGNRYATEAWHGVERAFNDYSRKWVAQRTEACEATRLRGEQSEALLDLKMQCLDVHKKEAIALSELFTQADTELVTKAVVMAVSLPRLDDCTNSQQLLAKVPPPRDATTRARVGEFETQLAKAKALYIAGKFRESLKLTERISSATVSLGYRALDARVLLQKGSALVVLGKDEAGG